MRGCRMWSVGTGASPAERIGIDETLVLLDRWLRKATFARRKLEGWAFMVRDANPYVKSCEEGCHSLEDAYRMRTECLGKRHDLV